MWEQDFVTCFGIYKTLLLKELKSTIRKYSAGLEFNVEPIEEELLHLGFLVEKEW